MQTPCPELSGEGLTFQEEKMPILYALVSRESCVLAEFTAVTGNFQQVTRLILQKRPSEDGNNSWAYDE